MISLRLRVKRRTSPSRRWAWMRAPSSFHSTDAGPVAASAAATSVAGDASIGCTARPGHHARRRASASTPPVSAARGRRAEVAGQHVGPAHGGDRHAGRLGDGVDHHAVERPLAQLAAENIFHSSSCSASVARPNTSASRPRRAALTPAPDIAASRSTARVDLEDVERRRRRRLGPHVAQRRPPDADAALAQRAGQHADGDRHLVGRQPAQHVGQQRRLLAALRRRRQRPRRVGQLDEQHGLVTVRPPSSESAGATVS